MLLECRDRPDTFAAQWSSALVLAGTTYWPCTFPLVKDVPRPKASARCRHRSWRFGQHQLRGEERHQWSARKQRLRKGPKTERLISYCYFRRGERVANRLAEL